ncbi:hypothetical protein IT881_08835 [Erythrobacter sp. A30-3]|nr:hypothetical protein IT881_08835 [Erythrobacter sp. A30-3]
MKFFAGLAVGAVLVGGLAAYLIGKNGDEPVRFPTYQLMDIGDYVRLEGSLVGGESPPVNGFYSVQCFEDRLECEITSISEIAHKHLGMFDQSTLPVSEWSETHIRMSSKDEAFEANACNFYEIDIDRENKSATYTRRPSETAPADCSERFEEKVLRWRFDDGKAWAD